MRIHHLNCGTCCPVGGRAFDGRSDGLFGALVCHCLLIETDAGLLLVDTGFGTKDVDRPGRRLSRFFLGLNNPELRSEETAIAQVRALGFDPRDVRHIIVTHLDFDHAGGLEDFPNAAVHVTAREKEVADQGRGGAFEALSFAEPDVVFVGRLATYRYYNMDQVVGQALATYRRLKERAPEAVPATRPNRAMHRFADDRAEAVDPVVSRPPELWGGIECTVNRVGDRYRYRDQTRLGGHDDRPGDLDLFADLGLRALRYPVLWERTVPDRSGVPDWTWSEARLGRLRALGIRPIAGLVHHGSGPRHMHLLDDGFAPGLGAYAGLVAARYPWIEE